MNEELSLLSVLRQCCISTTQCIYFSSVVYVGWWGKPLCSGFPDTTSDTERRTYCNVYITLTHINLCCSNHNTLRNCGTLLRIFLETRKYLLKRTITHLNSKLLYLIFKFCVTIINFIHTMILIFLFSSMIINTIFHLTTLVKSRSISRSDVKFHRNVPTETFISLIISYLLFFDSFLH